MSISFTPFTLGPLQIKNRFIFSACEDSAATDDGLITDTMLKRYNLLSKGNIGLIISSHLSVHPLGRTRKMQLGIYHDNMIQGLTQVTRAVHQYEGKIIFQLGHAGTSAPQDIIGHAPPGPSSDPPLQEHEILEIINSFIAAAKRAAEAGADGIQIHAAHGYLINQFLSPFYNKRQDSWGGSEENCFRLLKEIIIGTKKNIPTDMALLIKLNTHDHTPEEGITIPRAIKYAERIAQLQVDGVEISCGTSLLSPWNMCRGAVPTKELLMRYPDEQKSRIEKILKNMEGKFDLVEGYNIEAAKMIRPMMKKVPLFAVGGWRSLSEMEQALTNGSTDCIPLCRPLIREPLLVKHFQEGSTEKAACTSCNKCLAALANNMRVRCYEKGF